MEMSMATRIKKRCISLFLNKFNLYFDRKLIIMNVMNYIIYKYITK